MDHTFHWTSSGTVSNKSGKLYSKKMSISSDIESMRQNVWLYETVMNNTSPDVQKRSSPHSGRNLTLDVGVNQADSDLVPVANVMGTATVHREPAISSWAPHVRQLVLDQRSVGDPPLPASVCALQHHLLVHFHVFRGLPDTMVNGVKGACVRKGM
jgi:hypothetical protein